MTGSGGVGVAKTCGGDIWSSWAGQQPSHTAYGFDGYQWLLDANPITGQTGNSYTPTTTDAGHQLSCTVKVTYPLLVVTTTATSAPMLVKGAAELLTDLATAVAQVRGSHRLAREVAAIQRRVTANHTKHACVSLHAFISDVRARQSAGSSAGRRRRR